MPDIYLDNAATTQVSPAVSETVLSCIQILYGNPSSLHKMGADAEGMLGEARRQIAALLHVNEREIFFTSGGTESNNWAIFGGARARARRGQHLITSSLEHPSVLEAFRQLEREGFSLTVLPADAQGIIQPKALQEALRPDTILVSIMAVNNEIGSIQPLEDLGKIIKENNPETLFHVDGIQVLGKLPFYPTRLGVDLFSGSGHKIHGPKGSGFLYISDKVRILPLLYGGGQEKGLRSGTENVPGHGGLGTAAREAREALEPEKEHLYQLKEKLWTGLSALEGVRINGPEAPRLGAPHIISASFLGIRSEVLLHALEEQGIYVSAGSACSSHKREISPVLKAIGLDKGQAESTLRFSLCRYNREEEIEKTLTVLRELLPALRRFVRR